MKKESNIILSGENGSQGLWSVFHAVQRLIPGQELPECCPPMAVLRLFLRGQLGEGFLDLWKIEKRIVTKTIRSPRPVQEYAFRLATKGLQRMPVLRGGNHADKPGGSLLLRNLFQLAQQARVVGFIVGAAVGKISFARRISGRIHAWSAA